MIKLIGKVLLYLCFLIPYAIASFRSKKDRIIAILIVILVGSVWVYLVYDQYI